MRTIEVRAFNKISRSMIASEDVSIYSSITHLNKNLISDDSFILLQFTGLYDCKGVKIFEGDKVVLRYSNKEGIYMKGVIKYGEKNIGMNGFEYNNIIYGFYPDTNNSDIEYLYSKFVSGEVEVVGNIYEDKELI